MRELEITVEDQELLKKQQALAKNSEDAHEVLNKIADEMTDIEREFFRNPKGLKRNAPSTIKRKGKNAPLKDKGRLEKALTSKHATDQVRKVKKDYLIFGVSKRQYWIEFNVRGDGVPKRNPMVPITRKAGKERLGNVFLEELMRISGFEND